MVVSLKRINDFSNQSLFKVLLLVCDYGGISDSSQEPIMGSCSSSSFLGNLFFLGSAGLADISRPSLKFHDLPCLPAECGL